MDLVLNWLWQGGIIALVGAAALGAISPCRPQARYAVAWAASLGIVALPVMTLIWALISTVPASAVIPAPPPPVLSIPQAWWTSTEVVAALWITWMAVYAIRAAVDAMVMWQTKRSCRTFPPEREAALRCWSGIRSNGRHARLMISNRVRAAGMLGGANPVIAIAPELLDLSDADLDCIAVHEWTHVQRRDDVARFAQVVIQTIAGWHPGLRWLERHLHIEREASCDLAAIEVVGSAKDYAACLARIASRAHGADRRVPALSAAAATGLRQRIIRILTKSAPPSRSWQLTAIATAAMLTIVAFGVGRLRLVDTAAEAVEPPGTAPGSALTVAAPAAIVSEQALDRSRAVPRQPLRRSHAAASAAATLASPLTTPKSAIAQSQVETNADAGQTSNGFPVENANLIASISPVAIDNPATDAALIEPSSASGPVPQTPADTPVWVAAANTGKAVGRGSEGAARATASLFTRFGRKIAASF